MFLNSSCQFDLLLYYLGGVTLQQRNEKLKPQTLQHSEQVTTQAEKQIKVPQNIASLQCNKDKAFENSSMQIIYG